MYIHIKHNNLSQCICLYENNITLYEADEMAVLCCTEPSRITQGPSSMEIMVGESIVLPCQVTVDPALDVSFSWAFNGQLIDFEHDSEHFERVGGVSKNQHCFLADSTVLFCPVS